MDVEDVTGERLLAREADEVTATARDRLPACFVKSSINDQDVAARFHEVLGDAHGRVGRDARQARRVVALRDDDDRGVPSRHALGETASCLHDGGASLPNGAE